MRSSPSRDVNAARVPIPRLEAYGANKAAVTGPVRGGVCSSRSRRSIVNAIQPGSVNTRSNHKDGPFADIVKPSLATPEHAEGRNMASPVAWIAGPEARYVTGAALTVDGGFLA